MKINNVKRMSLWNQITETVERENTWGWKLLDNGNITCCKFDKEWMANIITANDVSYLNTQAALFFVAQTGAGKTTAILESFLPVALRKNKKVLYVSNRVSLDMQMKERCMNDKLNQQQRVGRVLVKDMKNYYKPLYLKQTWEFGGIDIMTYHKLLQHIAAVDFNQYAFVFLDEAHYFMSDATFNVFTMEILEKIIEKTQNANRVYLTATPEECFAVIYEAERLASKGRCNDLIKRNMSQIMQVYVMQEAYDYLDTYFFSSVSFITERIKRSLIRENWLIFVRDKKMGDELKETLSNSCGEVEFITAESDREDEKYMDLITKEELPCRVMISTKVLDVGINIRTENLNIVLFEDNLVEMKQMIGRKRMENNERLSVYIHIPSYQQLKKRKGLAESKFNVAQQVFQRMQSGNFGYHREEEFPMYRTPKGELKINHLTIKKLQLDMIYYSDLLDQLEAFSDDNKAYLAAYAEHVLKNFPGKELSLNMILETQDEDVIDDEIAGQLTMLMQSWMGQSFGKEERDVLSGEIMKILGDGRSVVRNDRGNMGISSLNKILKPYRYQILNLGKTPAVYKVVTCGDC